MSDTDFDRLERIFADVIDLATGERKGFLDEACGKDATLRARVESMLADHVRAAGFMRVPNDVRVPNDAAVEPGTALVGQRIGRYRIDRVIDSGGMGTIYVATQDEPQRDVALKVMNRGIVSRSALRRFQFEAEVLARLHHPNIAQVYEAGTHDDGDGRAPWFAMEYIADAQPITAYADAEKVGTRDRLAMFAKVCQAVHHGHQKGVIHRDLKPSNILVDAAGEPKIIDFGVARATDLDIAVTTLQTDLGQLIGTLQYMSPEQVDADPHDLDVRSDVYSLGVVLYELLCAGLPYDVSGTRIYEATRIIREQSPKRPSTIDRAMRGDLETIVLRALEKDRERRYQSAADLAEDLRRYLGNQAIMARPASAMYQIRVFARRHRTPVAAASLAAFALVVATVVSVGFAIAAGRAKTDLTAERDALAYQAYIGHMAGAEAAVRSEDVQRMRFHLAAAPSAHRGWEWRYLFALSDASPVVLEGHESRVVGVATSPDGQRIASAARFDRSVRVWDANTGELLAPLEHPAGVKGVAFSPDGDWLATGCKDGIARLWHVHGTEPTKTLTGHTDWITGVAFSPDGTRLGTAGRDGTVRMWDLSTGDELSAEMSRDAGWLYGLVFSPDGRFVATGRPYFGWRERDNTIRIWDGATGDSLRSLHHEEALRPVAFTPDGRWFISGSNDHLIHFWDTRTWQQTGVILRGHRGIVMDVAVSPNGKLLASASVDRTVKLWDLDSLTVVRTLYGHVKTVDCLAFNHDSTRLVSGSWDHTVRVWDLTEPAQPIDIEPHPDRWQSRVLFSPDGRLVASRGDDGTVRLRDSVTLETLVTLPVSPQARHALAFHPDGRRLATGSGDGVVTMWDTCTARELDTLRREEKPVRSLMIGPRGKLLVSCSDDGSAQLWDIDRAALIRSIPHDGPAWPMALSPDGQCLARVSRDRDVVLVWDTASARQIATMRSHEAEIRALTFSPDGQHLVTGSQDLTMRIWDVRTGRQLKSVDSHGRSVSDLSFSPDGQRLASSHWYSAVKIWDARTFEPLASLSSDQLGGVVCVAFSPDGTRLAAGGLQGIRIWDARPSRERREEREGALAHAAEATMLVDRCLDVLGEPGRAADALWNDTTLERGLRRAALNDLLRRAGNE